MEITLQFLVVFFCIILGARIGGMAVGLFSGLGVVILVFIFKLMPGEPPIQVLLTIISVVSASATLQASGGLEVFLKVAEKLLRHNPKYLSIFAPFATCCLTMVSGTGHTVYSLLPIIYDIAIKNNIRPERPMAGASVASQMGIIASPLSVGLVTLAAILAETNSSIGKIDFITILSITIPSTLLGVLMIGIFSWFRGAELSHDKKFQALITDSKGWEYVYGGAITTYMDKRLSSRQWIAASIFIGAIIIVSLLGVFESLRPAINDKPLLMTHTIQMIMLLTGALIVLVTRTDPQLVTKNEVFQSGMVAVVVVFGIVWMSVTVFKANELVIKDGLKLLVENQIWIYPLALSIISAFLSSQAAVISLVVPIALSVGLPVGYVIAFAPACYGYFILPTYPSDLAAIRIDRSGTTRIGKYVLNHSFILPGIIGVSTSCIVGFTCVSVKQLL